eukprot:360243-Chlamydomonas_euryale.AAC.6
MQGAHQTAHVSPWGETCGVVGQRTWLYVASMEGDIWFVCHLVWFVLFVNGHGFTAAGKGMNVPPSFLAPQSRLPTQRPSALLCRWTALCGSWKGREWSLPVGGWLCVEFEGV